MAICIVVPILNRDAGIYDRIEDPIMEVFYENTPKDKVMVMRYDVNLTGDVIGGRKYDVKKSIDLGSDGVFKPVKWRYQGEIEWKKIERKYL